MLDLHGQRVLVLGLGISGRSAAQKIGSWSAPGTNLMARYSAMTEWPAA